MPKEITHWLIAEKVCSLIEDEKARRALERYKNLFYLGAVIPDTPFYAVLSNRRSAVKGASKTLHGEGGGAPWGPFFRLFDLIGDQNSDRPISSEAIFAFAAGALLHMTGDAFFHPMVVYFSGPPGAFNDPYTSEIRHRKFETCLDLFFRDTLEVVSNNNGRLKKTISRCELAKTDLDTVIKKFLSRPEVESGPVDREPLSLLPLLKFHSFLQGLFFQRWAYFLFPLLSPLTKPFGLTGAEFYPRRHGSEYKLYAAPIPYRHPSKGTSREKSAVQIFDNACLFGLRLLYSAGEVILGSNSSERAERFISSPEVSRLADLVRDNDFAHQEFYDVSVSISSLIRGNG
jgi:hypothetical protein